MLATSGDEIAVISVLSAMSVAVIGILAHQWRRVRVAAYNARLKQLMIERGMTADEIERVLSADGAKHDRHG